jgi:Flp pilus assembly protein TadB
MQSFSKDIRQLAWNLGLLTGLVILSIALFTFQAWLRASGGWALVVSGLICLWSALLAVLAVVQERRRRRHEQAIDAALADIRRAIGHPSATRNDDDRA